MSFESNDPRWTAYALGELDPEQTQAMEALIEHDPDARAFAASLRETARQMTEALADAPRLRLDEPERRRIEQVARAPRRRRWPVIAALGAAAMAVGAVLLGTADSTESARATSAASPTHAAAARKASTGDVSVTSRPDPTPRPPTVLVPEPDMAPQPAPPSEPVKVSLAEGNMGGRPRGHIAPHKHRILATGADNAGSDREGGEEYASIDEREFVAVADDPRSTFSIDVDTASYAVVRRMLVAGQPPPAGAVRVEEMINYFDYAYPPPRGDEPFAIHTETIVAPWNRDHLLLRVGIQSQPLPERRRAQANLVFLIDVSGSMGERAKLPLVKQSLELLLDALDDEDRIALVVYAGDSGIALGSTPVANRGRISRAIERLQSGGSTNGGAGIHAAYAIAAENFVEGGINRVILATDGDFNVGVSSHEGLIDLIETKAKTGVFLTVLGFGMGNYKDATLEQIADRGNGAYGYIDTLREARKLLVDGIDATLVTVARDVKIQVEFNPSRVSQYRLIGYENRSLAHRDFADDRKDAGDVGAGHAVTALYELVPSRLAGAASPEVMTFKLRYKHPDGGASRLIEQPVFGEVIPTAVATVDTRFAAAIAGFGMLLRDSPHAGDMTLAQVRELAAGALGTDRYGYRAEALELMTRFEAIRTRR